MSPCQIVAWNLERIRRTRGWSQDEAAHQLEPLLGYQMSRAAFSKAERCAYRGQIRRFDADEIVAFARVFEVPIAYFFGPPEPHFRGKPVVVNSKPGRPGARIAAPPLTRQDMLGLAQGMPEPEVLAAINERAALIRAQAVADGVSRYLRENPKAVAHALLGELPADFWEGMLARFESERTGASEQRMAQAALEELQGRKPNLIWSPCQEI